MQGFVRMERAGLEPATPSLEDYSGDGNADHEPRRTPVSMRICGVLGTQSPRMLTWSVFESFWPLSLATASRRGGVPRWPPPGNLAVPRYPNRSRRPPPMPCGYHDPRRGADPSTGRFQQLAGNRLTAPPLFLEQRPQRVGVDHRAAGAPMPHGCAVLPAAGSRVFPSVLATNLRHAQSSQDSNSGRSVPLGLQAA